jgi:hypothetical protein
MILYHQNLSSIHKARGFKMNITDPVFGVLKHDGYGWTGKVAVFGYALELEFAGDPTTDNKTAYQNILRAFLEQQGQIKTSLEKAVFDYYGSNLEEFRVWCEPEQEEALVPTLHHPREIWSQVNPFLMSIDCENPEQPSIYIEFQANWDSEHGMDVMFRDHHIGVADAGANWLDHTRYDLEGNRLRTEF